MEAQEKSRFDGFLASIMTGVCPDCGGEILEQCIDLENEEWLITCSGCPFQVIFAGMRR